MMLLIHAHLVEVYQLVAAIIGAIAAAALLFFADQSRRRYKETGENDPEMMATAASNIRDEGFRLSKHLLFVVIGIVTIVMEEPGELLPDRAGIVRWILILCSTLMVIQSLMVWRDRKDSERRAGRPDRRDQDA